MRIDMLATCLGLALSGLASAQVSAPDPARASDPWRVPAASRSIDYRQARPLPGTPAGTTFDFKPRGPQPIQGQPPHVLDGTQAGSLPRIQSDGRPALNCAQTPQDPKCR